MTQCERVLKYMKDFGSISPMEAMQDLGCQRLAARIADLREQGCSIRSEWESGKNRYGESTTYKRYRLEGKGESCEKVLQYMKDFGSISQKEAIEDLGYQGLTSLIADLKGQGYKIGFELETSRNRYGETTTYKRYRLEHVNETESNA